MVAVGRFASSAFFGVFVLYAVAPGPMRLNEPEFGLLFTTFAAGSLIGSVLVGPVTARVDRARILIGSMLVWGLSFLIPALTTNSLVVGTGFFIGGVATMLWNVTNVSLRQRLLPSNLLGRVHASHRLFASVAGIAGGVVGGLVAEVAGIRAVFIVAAAAGALTALGAFIVTDEAIERAEAAVPVNGPHS
jgi:MFS family permease